MIPLEKDYATRVTVLFVGLCRLEYLSTIANTKYACDIDL